MNASLFINAFRDLSDEDWLNVLLRSVAERVIDGVRFPDFPDPEFQRAFVGSSGTETLREAFLFYAHVKRFALQFGVAFDPSSAVLDFGCGWGRLYRTFLRDFSPDRFLGIDIDARCIELCRAQFPLGRFQACEPMPPLALTKEGSFDIIYAYSVLSHLSEAAHLAWIAEFGRLLRVGGMLIATTLKGEHIRVWDELARRGGPHWARLLDARGFSADGAAQDFREGRFLYCAVGGGGVRRSEFYGEAIVSPAFARRAWRPWFEDIQYVSQDTAGPQAILVARRKV
jgi:2-polyprenyl-3-methyl-5-hydroxy-6-metoxy-1,4-benzoquinol methylase